jgi:hypothetical protein
MNTVCSQEFGTLAGTGRRPGPAGGRQRSPPAGPHCWSDRDGPQRVQFLIRIFLLTKGCCEIARRSKERRGLTIVTRDELLERMPEESPFRSCRIRSDMTFGWCNAADGWCESCRQMSRRDCIIVAWHEVPGTARPKTSRPVGYGMIGADLMTGRGVLGYQNVLIGCCLFFYLGYNSSMANTFSSFHFRP